MSALGEGAAPLVCPFYYRGDDSRPMRVVVTSGNGVWVEETTGCDALGVPRWTLVDLEADERSCSDGGMETEASEWVAMVALAIAYEFAKGGEAAP